MYGKTMKVHFEFYTGITHTDIEEFLKEKGVRGEWFDMELNVFRMYDSWTIKDWDMIHALCMSGFEVKGVPVKGTMIVPPPPELKRVDSVM